MLFADYGLGLERGGTPIDSKSFEPLPVTRYSDPNLIEKSPYIDSHVSTDVAPLRIVPTELSPEKATQEDPGLTPTITQEQDPSTETAYRTSTVGVLPGSKASESQTANTTVPLPIGDKVSASYPPPPTPPVSLMPPVSTPPIPPPPSTRVPIQTGTDPSVRPAMQQPAFDFLLPSENKLKSIKWIVWGGVALFAVGAAVVVLK